MLKRVKTFFVRDKGLGRHTMTALGQLQPDERLAPLSDALHDVCAKTAARFVEEERQRGDSPFRDVSPRDLYHELLVMNFWILESLFKGTRQPLMDQIYGHYGAAFARGRETHPREIEDSLRGRFRSYDESWDDVSGHQDVFGREAIGIIFGGRQIATAPQAAFWLISYADRTMKDFTAVKRSVDRLLGEGVGPAAEDRALSPRRRD